MGAMDPINSSQKKKRCLQKRKKKSDFFLFSEKPNHFLDLSLEWTSEHINSAIIFASYAFCLPIEIGLESQ